MDFTALFCDVDDFVKHSNQTQLPQQADQKKKQYTRACRHSASEIMSICIGYHQSRYKNFKQYYLEQVIRHMQGQFPGLLSYNRFVEVMSSVAHLLTAYLVSKFGKSTGISFIDLTPIQVCKPKRMSRNKVFKGIGVKGKSSIGWFFGFKLHLIINRPSAKV